VGRQIRFYITQPDADALIELIRSKGGIFMSTSGEELTKDDLAQITNVEYIRDKYKDSCIYIKLPDSKLIFDHFARIYVDSMRSDVIQFLLPHPVKNKKDTFAEGRFWYETSYYNENGELVQNTLMKKMFDALVRYIRKNYIPSYDKSEYIGRDCYEKYKCGEYITAVNGGALLTRFD
jgi:hypothetical protein